MIVRFWRGIWTGEGGTLSGKGEASGGAMAMAMARGVAQWGSGYQGATSARGLAVDAPDFLGWRASFSVCCAPFASGRGAPADVAVLLPRWRRYKEVSRE